MAETTKSIPVTFANTGLVLKSSPDEIPITAYTKLVNMFTDLENSISVRNGFTRLNDGLPTPPHSSYLLRDYQGIIWRYAITGSKLYIAQVSPVTGVFSPVPGGDLLSAADDPRAMFGNYTLNGAEIKPYIFLADGKALLKHPGGSAPARRVGIPMPASGLAAVALGSPSLTSIEAFEDSTDWTPTDSSVSTVTGVISDAVEMDVTGASVLGTAYKALDLTTMDLDNTKLDEPIQFYVQFPFQADLANCQEATIEFNLSTTPSDVSFLTIMRATIDLSVVSPGVWSLQQIAKKAFTFQGVDPSLNWSNVTAIRIGLLMSDAPIANPDRGGALASGIIWDECNLNVDGGVSADAPDLQWTFTYYNSRTDTESDFATPVFGPQSGAVGYALFDLTFPICPLTTPPLADPDKIRIYRMGGTIEQFQRVDEIPYTPGTAPPVYHDGTPDEQLGDVLELDNQLPADAVLGLEFSDNRLWTWGGTVTDSLGNVVPEPPNRLRFSKRTRVELFPAENYIAVGTGSEAIQRVLEHDGELFVFTLTRVYRVVGSDLTNYQAPSTAVNQGLMSPFGVCRGTRQLFMYSYDGVYEFPSGTKVSEPINPVFFGKTINDYPPIQKGREHEIAMSFWNSKLYFSYPMTSDPSIRNDAMFVWDIIYNRWHFYLYGCQGLYTEPETKILGGSNITQWDAFVDGLPADFANAGAWVMHLEDGFFDQCEQENRGIFYDMGTKEFDLGFPDQEKRFIDYVVDANTGGSALILLVVFDGTTRETLGTIRTTQRDQVVFPVLVGEGEGFLARRIAITIIGRQDAAATSSIQLYKVIHRVLLEPMKHRMFVTEWSDYGTPSPKFFRELWVELDTFGFPLDRIEVQIDQALGAVIQANTLANGRQKFFYGLPPDLRGTLARLKIVPKGENEVKLWDHNFQMQAEPPSVNTYQMPWSEEQWPYPKLWKEVVFDIDTNNSSIDFDFWLDGSIKQSFSIRTQGRRLITKSLDQDLFGKLGRVTVDESFLDPFCCLPIGVRIYSIRYVIDKDPADVTFSDTYEQLMSYDRTKIIRRFWLAMKNPDADVTMQLYVDDILASTKTIPIDVRPTGHSKKRVDLESAIEGRLVRAFFTSPFPFQLYWEKSEIEMKGTNPEDGYGRYKLAPPQTM